MLSNLTDIVDEYLTYICNEYHPTGNISKRVSYFNQRKHGKQGFYHINGSPLEVLEH
jgi:antitoxin component YwqK of YwqJK toxin-antitoxin module